MNRIAKFLKTLVCSRINGVLSCVSLGLQSFIVAFVSVYGCQDDWCIERQEAHVRSDAAVLEPEHDPWLLSLTSQESWVWSKLGQEYSWEYTSCSHSSGQAFLKKSHRVGSRRASSDICVWASALHKTRKQYCCSQEHLVKQVNNAKKCHMCAQAVAEP